MLSTTKRNKTFNICEGDYIEAIGPTAAGYTYAWSNGVATKIDTIKKTGKYWVVVANGRGCTDTLGPFFVVVNPLPFASILSADTFCQNSTAKLSALPGPGYTYNWTSIPAQAIGATNPTFFPSRYNYGFVGNLGVYFDKSMNGGKRMIIGVTHHTRGGERYQDNAVFYGTFDQQYKNNGSFGTTSL